MLALIVAGSVLLAAVAARLAPPEPVQSGSPRPPLADDSDIKGYAGNEACQSCHPTEFADHRSSNHARALHVMSRAELGALCPAPGRINDLPYSLVEKAGKFYFEVKVPEAPDKYQLWPLDYAFGSGKTGMTFVSMLDGRNIAEMKMSYFPGERVWRVTPGQDLGRRSSAGRTRDLKQSHRCFECHTNALSRNEFTPKPAFLGVGCESCHGPGAAHIAAVRSGASATHMEPLGKLSARELNTRCGSCHSTDQDISQAPSAISARMTYRFQPYGLMQSRCFRESPSGLSCLNCHNPHQNDSTSHIDYEKTCLKCHSSPKSQRSADIGNAPGKVCPVNPRADCIRCHMPKRDFKFTTNEHLGLLMTEHKIAVYRDIK